MRRWLLAGVLGLTGAAAAGQAPPRAQPEAATIVLGPATLPVSGSYSIAVRLRGGTLAAPPEFPELEGFKKAGRSNTVTTRTVQGRSFRELTLTQRYLPYGEGSVVVPPFQMTVNGQVLRSPGATVQVGAAAASAGAGAAAPAPLTATGSLDQLFGKPKPGLYEELPDGAYLALEAARPRVYVGQGVAVGLYFYLRPADQALLAFHDFDDQLPRLLRRLQQPTAWAAPGPEPALTPDSVRRRGQPYLRFRLSENTYYPLTANALQFPPLALTMTKFRQLRKPEPGVDNRLATFKTYLAPGLAVAVLPLPTRPGQPDAPPVGDYRLREALSRPAVRTGQAVEYTIGVEGEGNLAALLAPVAHARPGFLDVFGPEVRSSVTATGGTKLFRYRLVPRRPGPVALDSLLRLIVFNPRTARFDTLRPTLKLHAQGAAVPSATARPADDPFYGPAISAADATLQPLDVYQQVRRYAAWLLLGLAAVAVAGAAAARKNK